METREEVNSGISDPPLGIDIEVGEGEGQISYSSLDVMFTLLKRNLST